MKTVLSFLTVLACVSPAFAGSNNIVCGIKSYKTGLQIVQMKKQSSGGLIIFEGETDDFNVHINISRFGDPDAQVLINDMKSSIQSRGIISINKTDYGNTQLALQTEPGRLVSVFCKYKR